MPFVSSVEGAQGQGRTGSSIVLNGLQLNLDAGNPNSQSGSGSTWFDLTSFKRNATLQNTPTYSSNQNGYFSFLDTSFQYATVPDIGSLSQWTVEAWTRLAASLTGKVTSVVSNQFDLATKLNQSLGTNNAPGSQTLAAGQFNGAWRTTSGFTPTLNTWQQVVGTQDGTTITQQTNAAVNTTLSYTGTPQSGGEIRIARRWDSPANDSANYLKGDVSVVRIQNRALSATEVLQNQNAVKSRQS